MFVCFDIHCCVYLINQSIAIPRKEIAGIDFPLLQSFVGIQHGKGAFNLLVGRLVTLA